MARDCMLKQHRSKTGHLLLVTSSDACFRRYTATVGQGVSKGWTSTVQRLVPANPLHWRLCIDPYGCPNSPFPAGVQSEGQKFSMQRLLFFLLLPSSTLSKKNITSFRTTMNTNSLIWDFIAANGTFRCPWSKWSAVDFYISTNNSHPLRSLG